MSSSRRSRNGCANCRAKRQKCDEAQPGCLRCQRAGLECKGYINAKELRWRPVDKRDLSARVNAKTQKSLYSSDASRCSGPTVTSDEGLSLSNGCHGWPDSLTAGSLSSADSECLIMDDYIPADINEWTSIIGELPSDVSNVDSYNLPVDFDAFDLDFEGLLPMPAFMFHSGLPTTEPQASSSIITNVDTVTLEPSDPTEKSRSSPKTILCPTAPVSLSPRLSLIQPSRNVHDMLIAHFNRKTCGILSIKDGPVGNPWRTLILPLSEGSRAVEHAITCMAAFHGAYDSPDLYTHGTVDMDKSYKCLALEEKRQPLIPALAAWVGLAFAEGWKTPTMARLTPMVNARRLLAEQLTANRTAMPLTKTDTARLKYLINAFVFVHTIGGITARSDEEAPPLPPQVVSFLTPSPDEARMETDPLLGCAASIFPLIDTVVSIVQKARRTHRNSLALVSRASEVHEQLQQWQPPHFSIMESFEEQMQVVQHSIQTAQALRYATLLHLHQAVPEIPSESSAELARKVLLKLASIPSSSVVTNLHIFPLLAASVELTDPEDREWAEQRWHAIIGRLRVKNVDTCWDIVLATWARRDIHEAGKVPAEPRADIEIDPVCTVRGKLHWLNVMEDRNWQVFVG